MIIERHRLIGQLPIKRRVSKVTKIEPARNGANMDGQNRMMGLSPDMYDTVMAYCQKCHKRIDIPIVHDKATNNQFQLVSVPVEFSNKLNKYKAYCNHCGSTNIIEKQEKISSYEVFTIKLDEARAVEIIDKSSGTDDWYEDSTSSGGDGHPRKF